MNSNVTIGTNIEIQVRDSATNELRRIIRTHNLFVNSGLWKLGDLFAYPNRSGDEDSWGDGKTPTYVAVGTNSTDTTAAMTTLGTEVYRSSLIRRTRDGYSVILTHYISPSEANGNLLTEVGLFTESNGGLLWSRATHTSINKTGSISVTYKWTFTFGAS